MTARPDKMPILASSLAALIASAAALSAVAESAKLPRVIIVSLTEQVPPADHVVQLLAAQVADLQIDLIVDSQSAETLPASSEQWASVAQALADHNPGTVAVFGYQCAERRCMLIAVEPQRRSVVEVPVDITARPDVSESFAIACTARELLLGPLLPETLRLAREGENPGPPPPSPDSVWLRPPREEERKRVDPGPLRPVLWIEGGYNGEHPYPGGHPVHGPWLGASYGLNDMFAAAVNVGWLGIQKDEVPAGEVVLNRIAATLSLRVLFSLGPAHVSIAPVGRADVAISRLDPRSGADRRDGSLELHVGGLTSWHLPLPAGLEAIVGAGVLATLRSRAYAIDGEEVIAASKMRLAWQAGLSWSPFKSQNKSKRKP